MGLDFAIDELYQTGWTAGEASGCRRDAAGRLYPSAQRVARECADAGLRFTVRHIQLFSCYRAEWVDAAGETRGAVVGQTEDEAAVYALAQLRRSHEPAVAG